MLADKQLIKEILMSFFDNDNRINEIPLLKDNGIELTTQAVYLLQKATDRKGYWWCAPDWWTLSNILGIDLPTDFHYGLNDPYWIFKGKKQTGTYAKYQELVKIQREKVKQEFIKRVKKFVDGDGCFYFDMDTEYTKLGYLIIVSPKIATFDFLETENEQLDFICK